MIYPRLIKWTTFALLALVCATVRAQQETPAFTEAEIAAALKRYEREPTVEQVVRATLKAAADDPEAAERLADRARASGWVPTVRLAARRGIGAGLYASQTLETDRTNLTTDNDLVLEASLTFELDKLVFDNNEVAIAREKRAANEARQELVRTAIELYFERRRLQLERDLGIRIEPKTEMRIAQIEALLNVFTNGEFGRIIIVYRQPVD